MQRLKQWIGKRLRPWVAELAIQGIIPEVICGVRIVDMLLVWEELQT